MTDLAWLLGGISLYCLFLCVAGAIGEWWAWAPCRGASPAKITNHQVVEHEDGTITASPSILMNFGAHGVTWHGYLERGVWREV